MDISKLMNPNLITCRTHDNLERAAGLMWEHDVGCLPVIDDEGRVAGMITDRDICMAAYTCGTHLRDIAVTTPMAKTVYSCAPDDDLRHVEKIMQVRQIRRMPVIDASGHPVGVISLNDIARSSHRGGVPASEVAATLAAVSAPRPSIVAPS